MHINHRHSGGWPQRYQHGIPVTDLVPVAGDGSTGTTVHFMPDPALLDPDPVSAAQLSGFTWSPPLTVDINVVTAT